jgi:hypothetical protein
MNDYMRNLLLISTFFHSFFEKYILFFDFTEIGAMVTQYYNKMQPGDSLLCPSIKNPMSIIPITPIAKHLHSR